MLLENVNSRFMKYLAIPNIWTYFYMVYSTDCLVFIINHILESYIKVTDNFFLFLEKAYYFLPKLLDGIVISTVDLIGLYSKIPHKNYLSLLHKRLESWNEKYKHLFAELVVYLMLKTAFLSSEKKFYDKNAEQQ